MEEAVEFLKKFFEAERAALWAKLGDPFDEYREKLAAMSPFLGDGMLTGITGRSSTHTPEEVSAWKAEREELRGRVLFLVREYKDKKLGTVYRGYCSHYDKGSNGYFTSFFVATRKKKLALVARYNICGHCDRTGKQQGKTCIECKGFGWIHRGGARLEKTLGKALATRQLEEPEDELSRADYYQ